MLTTVEGLWNVYMSEQPTERESITVTYDVVKVVAVHGSEASGCLVLDSVDWWDVSAKEKSSRARQTIFIPPRAEGESDHELGKALWSAVKASDFLCDCSSQREVELVVPGHWRGVARHHAGCRKARERRKAAKRSKSRKKKGPKERRNP